MKQLSFREATKDSNKKKKFIEMMIKKCTSEKKYSGDMEDYSESKAQVEYFTAKMQRNDWHKWLIRFYSYLCYLDCGRKENRARLQHAGHIKTILQHLDPKDSGIDISAEGYIVWTQYEDRNVSKTFWDNKQLVTFLTADHVRLEALTMLPVGMTKILWNIKEILKGWRWTVDLEMQQRKNRQRLAKRDTCLTIDNVEKFKASRPMMSRRKALQKAANNLLLT